MATAKRQQDTDTDEEVEAEPAKALSARPNDTPEVNSTFASRAKRVASAQNKAVKASESK